MTSGSDRGPMLPQGAGRAGPASRRKAQARKGRSDSPGRRGRALRRRSRRRPLPAARHRSTRRILRCPAMSSGPEVAQLEQAHIQKEHTRAERDVVDRNAPVPLDHDTATAEASLLAYLAASSGVAPLARPGPRSRRANRPPEGRAVGRMAQQAPRSRDVTSYTAEPSLPSARSPAGWRPAVCRAGTCTSRAVA